MLDCLEVGEAIIDDTADMAGAPTKIAASEGTEEAPPTAPTKVDTFVLNRKAREAAEGYLVARYQLYRSVYYHKTTRSAEVVLRVFLCRLAELLKKTDPSALGLPADDPTVTFLCADKPTLAEYLASYCIMILRSLE